MDKTADSKRQIMAWLALNGLSVPDLADALGVTPRTVYNYLSGRQAWTGEAARIVSLVCGVPLRQLIDPKGEAAGKAADWLAELQSDGTEIKRLMQQATSMSPADIEEVTA